MERERERERNKGHKRGKAKDMVGVIHDGSTKRGRESKKRWEQQIKWTVKGWCRVEDKEKTLHVFCISVREGVCGCMCVRLLIPVRRLPAEMSSPSRLPLQVRCPSNRWAKPTVIGGGSVMLPAVTRDHTEVSLTIMKSWWQSAKCWHIKLEQSRSTDLRTKQDTQSLTSLPSRER